MVSGVPARDNLSWRVLAEGPPLAPCLVPEESRGEAPQGPRWPNHKNGRRWPKPQKWELLPRNLYGVNPPGKASSVGTLRRVLHALRGGGVRARGGPFVSTHQSHARVVPKREPLRPRVVPRTGKSCPTARGAQQAQAPKGRPPLKGHPQNT